MSAPRSLYVEGAPILTRDEAQALAKRILYFATADSTRVTIRSAARANSRFAVNQMSTAGDNFDTVVTVLSTFGKRSATAERQRSLPPARSERSDPSSPEIQVATLFPSRSNVQRTGRPSSSFTFQRSPSCSSC